MSSNLVPFLFMVITLITESNELKSIKKIFVFLLKNDQIISEKFYVRSRLSGNNDPGKTYSFYSPVSNENSEK